MMGLHAVLVRNEWPPSLRHGWRVAAHSIRLDKALPVQAEIIRRIGLYD